MFSSKPENDPGRANALTLLAGAKRDRDRALANLNWLTGMPDPEEVALADAQSGWLRRSLRMPSAITTA